MQKWWKDPIKREIVSNKISKKLKGTTRPSSTTKTVFKNKYSINEKTSCWELYKFDKKGYGKKSYRGKVFRAHRLSYILTNGNINDPMMNVCHSCDNPKCINPDHLWLGTQEENMNDMMRKGRGRIGKLSLQQKKDIKRLFYEGKTREELRKLYDTSGGVINYIIDKDKTI